MSGRLPGELLVRFRDETNAQARAAVRRKHGARLDRVLPIRGLQLVKLRPGVGVRSAQASLELDREVLYAEPNFYRQAAAIPNDPRFGELWGLHNTGQQVEGFSGTPDADIDAPEAGDTSAGGGITVAIVDSGPDYDHPDLAPNMWVNPGESGVGKESNGIDDDDNGFVDDARLGLPRRRQRPPQGSTAMGHMSPARSAPEETTASG